jgi:hypothetical protein
MKKRKFQTKGIEKLHLAKETISGAGQSQQTTDTFDQHTCVPALCLATREY